MRTVVVGTRPPEIDAFIASRREKGLDLFDEVWDGDYHMNPAPHIRHGQLDRQLARLLDPLALALLLIPTGPFNLGAIEDYRVPDAGYLRAGGATGVFVPTAELIVEIVSPGDESFEKLPHYEACGVREVLMVDPETRTVRVFRGAVEVQRCEVLDFTTDWLATQLDWPE